MRQAHADGWFIVFDTLTLADDRLEAFYDNPNALRDYCRDIGRIVLAAEGCKANDSHADCYQYVCVPEYGTANGRLHFFFFSSRRRLPRFDCDWSSDVCSSDLAPVQVSDVELSQRVSVLWVHDGIRAVVAVPLLRDEHVTGALVIRRKVSGEFAPSIVRLLQKIGRASCRERV